MPLRAGKTYGIPGRGVVSTKRKTYSGKGKGPAGTRKVKAPTAATTPTVTTPPAGQVTTQNFASPRAASQARRQARSSQRRVKRIERLQAQAEGFHRRTQQRVSERLPQPSAAALRKRDASISPKTVISSKPLGGTRPKDPSRQARSEAPPSYKPPKFQGGTVVASKPLSGAVDRMVHERPLGYKPSKFKGAKTAGAPSYRELIKADKAGKLRANRKGYVTTPAVRKVSGALKRLESKAKQSDAPLPGLTAQQSKVARTVLRRGVKVGATRKERLAAAETGLVESHFENLPSGDADSEGWRQERTSIYGTGPTGPRNVKRSADRFYKELRTDPGAATAPTAGLAAQAAQGSTFPQRYDERKPEANAIVKAFERGGLSKADQRRLLVARSKARGLGLKTVAPTVGPPPKQVVTRFKAIKKAAAALTSRHIPYVWGGGHGSIESAPSGLDCSGAVSWVLNKAGILKTPLTSGSMGEVLKPGPGAVTVFYNAEHTFMKIGNEYWGTSVGDSGAGGLGPHPAPSVDYLAQYNVGHVPGLGKKQALQLGFSPTASESFPGMTISSSGTTATINPDAGSTQEKAGFSKSPIKLTQAQKAHRTLKKLEQVGAGLSEKPSEGSESKASVLTGLERAYGKKAV